MYNRPQVYSSVPQVPREEQFSKLRKRFWKTLGQSLHIFCVTGKGRLMLAEYLYTFDIEHCHWRNVSSFLHHVVCRYNKKRLRRVQK